MDFITLNYEMHFSRYCEERSDEAIPTYLRLLRSFQSLAMTIWAYFVIQGLLVLLVSICTFV